MKHYINKLICALVGHKWIPFQNHDRWGFCVRCNKFSPTMIKDLKNRNFSIPWWYEDEINENNKW